VLVGSFPLLPPTVAILPYTLLQSSRHTPKPFPSFQLSYTPHRQVILFSLACHPLPPPRCSDLYLAILDTPTSVPCHAHFHSTSTPPAFKPLITQEILEKLLRKEVGGLHCACQYSLFISQNLRRPQFKKRQSRYVTAWVRVSKDWLLSLVLCLDQRASILRQTSQN
jgi:hypothetical protein